MTDEMIIKMIEEKGCELSADEIKEFEESFKSKDKSSAVDFLCILYKKFGRDTIAEITFKCSEDFNNYMIGCIYSVNEERGYVCPKEYNLYIK